MPPQMAALGNRSLASQAVAPAYALTALGLICVVLVLVVPNLAEAIRMEPVRIWLLAPVLLATGGLAFWCWRSPRARPPAWWLAAALPALAVLALYAPPMVRDVVRPSNPAHFAVEFLVLAGAATALVGALLAAAEERRGRAFRAGGGRGTAVVALAVLLVAGAGVYGLAAAIERPPGPGSAGQGPSGAQSFQVPPTAAGFTVAGETSGTVDALPEGTLAISVARYREGAGSFSEHSLAGIEYLVEGADHVSGKDLAPGQALFTPGGDRDHAVAKPSTWYLVFLKPAGQQGGLTGPGSQEVFASDPLPPLPRLNQVETGRVGTLAAHGRTALVKSGGVELILCLEGEVTVNAGTFSAPRRLQPGQAAYVLENTGVQVAANGPSGARFLAFYLTPAGRPVEKPA